MCAIAGIAQFDLAGLDRRMKQSEMGGTGGALDGPAEQGFAPSHARAPALYGISRISARPTGAGAKETVAM